MVIDGQLVPDHFVVCTFGLYPFTKFVSSNMFYVEMWYENVESFNGAMEFIHSDAGKELVIDGARFAEMKPGGLWIVEEHVIKDDTN